MRLIDRILDALIEDDCETIASLAVIACTAMIAFQALRTAF